MFEFVCVFFAFTVYDLIIIVLYMNQSIIELDDLVNNLLLSNVVQYLIFAFVFVFRRCAKRAVLDSFQ